MNAGFSGTWWVALQWIFKSISGKKTIYLSHSFIWIFILLISTTFVINVWKHCDTTLTFLWYRHYRISIQHYDIYKHKPDISLIHPLSNFKQTFCLYIIVSTIKMHLTIARTEEMSDYKYKWFWAKHRISCDYVLQYSILYLLKLIKLRKLTNLLHQTEQSSNF